MILRQTPIFPLNRHNWISCRL